ncbi:ABC transporter permease [Ramlibacter sp. G-1-2-2]|uniref:ABC transporter permease n=1 Tax=Ramlibacter agri TaxID=2728837 RepID=A0A848H5P5_9BURK|nr:ABC transporter permease [Ramlibacter agri]NML46115.1 ABC transporter permease [Ramlibacter agri]
MSKWKQFKRSRLALPGLVLFAAFVLAGLLAPLIAPHDPLQGDLANVMSTPSAQHWFGTDELGRDILSRILFGARISLVEGVLSAALAAAIGVPIGMLSAYAGGKVDTVIMRLIDVLLAFPGVLLAIVIISILGPSLANAILAVAIYTIPIFARFARGQTLSVKEEPYIEACRAMGMSNLRLLARHVLPNIAATVLALATLRVGINILTCASLSFLGLGAQAPLPEWGAMLANSRTALLIAPHMALFPGVAILLLVFGLNLFQDGLQVVLDPKSRGRA